MTDLTAIITEIEGLLEKATPGPWPAEPTRDYKRIIIGDGLVEGPHGYEVAEVYSDDCKYEEAEANANLIAAARNHLPALLSAAKRTAEAEAELMNANIERMAAEAALAMADNRMTKLEAHVATLREAIRPFAEEGARLPDQAKPTDFVQPLFFADSLRTAAKAYEETK